MVSSLFILRRAYSSKQRVALLILVSILLLIAICTIIIRLSSIPLYGKHGGLQEKEKYHSNALRKKWRSVLFQFMKTAPLESFSSSAIENAFLLNDNIVQNSSILVRIKDREVKFVEAYWPHQHSRAPSVKYIIEKIVRERYSTTFHDKRVNIVFPVCVSDGNRPKVATFGSARHWRNWHMHIPVPMGNERGLREGWGSRLEGWDSYMENGLVKSRQNYMWNTKIPKAMFRANLRMQTHVLGTCNYQNAHNCRKARSWEEVNRGVLYRAVMNHSNIFDVGFMGNVTSTIMPPKALEGAPTPVPEISFFDFQKYKILLNVGSNEDWAERLRVLLITNSAVVRHEAETEEFFYPLLRPWVHYIPTNLFFTDIKKNVQWALQNDRATKRIVKNANRFAKKYLSEYSMQIYWEVALEQFEKRQREADAYEKVK